MLAYCFVKSRHVLPDIMTQLIYLPCEKRECGFKNLGPIFYRYSC